MSAHHSQSALVHVAVGADERYDFVAALELDTHHVLEHLVLTLLRAGRWCFSPAGKDADQLDHLARLQLAKLAVVPEVILIIQHVQHARLVHKTLHHASRRRPAFRAGLAATLEAAHTFVPVPFYYQCNGTPFRNGTRSALGSLLGPSRKVRAPLKLLGT